MRQIELIPPDPGRRAFDFYETPAAVTRAFGRRMGDHLRGRRVFEPCAGNGAIVDVLKEEFDCYVTTNDIDPSRMAHTHLDAREPGLYHFHTSAEVYVSNLPFDIAADIVARSVLQLQRAPFLQWVAYLLPLNFMEPAEDRRELLVDFPPQHRWTTERIKFRSDTRGTAFMTTEWLVWTRDRQPLAGVPPHGVLLWKHL